MPNTRLHIKVLMGRLPNTNKPEQKEKWSRYLAFVITLDFSKQGNPQLWGVDFFVLSLFGHMGPNWISQIRAKLEFAKFTFLSLLCLGILLDTGFPKSSRNWNLQNSGFCFSSLLHLGTNWISQIKAKLEFAKFTFWSLPCLGILADTGFPKSSQNRNLQNSGFCFSSFLHLGPNWISQIKAKLDFAKLTFWQVGPKLDFTNHSKTGICQLDFFALPLFWDLGCHWISQIKPKLKCAKFTFLLFPILGLWAQTGFPNSRLGLVTSQGNPLWAVNW